MKMTVNFDPTTEDEWIDGWVNMLKTGNYTIWRTPFTKVGYIRVFLRRKNGVDSVPKMSHIFYIDLLEDEVEGFISRLKRKVFV